MPATVHNDTLIYKGSNFFRQRLLLSTLSGRSVRIEEIRSSHDDPGLREYEVSLIRLLDKVTNGTRVELSETGTSVFYQPGILIGGQVTHNCSTQRGIGYYLEVLLALGPFCKEPLNVVLQGVTHHDLDVSVDKVKAAALPILLKFILVDDGLELKVVRRGAPPLGGGEVVFRCPVRRGVRPLQWTSWGLVKRIRGVVYALRVSPTMANRVVEAAKGVMLKFLPDVYINTDQCRGPNAGKSPGFGISLVAETNEKTFYCAEAKSLVAGSGETTLPEDLGRECAQKLLDEIYRGGCVDSSLQWLVALWMALGQKDVSVCVVGPLSDYTITFLQHLKEFFGVMFKLEVLRAGDDDEDSGDEMSTAQRVKMTCVGIGYVNISKRTL
ncbi:probable RNA 3'-terminal phosphate cyclase-like protein [Leguminivora glycinivorella]|uniref:probable RNA 3'-terminal phosphate cyclase-like protein n=1 Tax=Leguminivora glycinivorella TaxID=1035111 RepID=UPI00200E689D|nr:probable RNA 3'-terminal phosphate cyclase-like protein [Leguminivora glycinivorella]